MEPPDALSAKGTAAEPSDSQRSGNFVAFSISPFPLALIHFLIDFSGFVCQLVSGRAGSKMTESHGLGGLFSGFYLLDFMRLEPRLPLSWRNVETILNPRTWTGDKRTLVTHLLPIPLVLSPRQGGTVVL